MRRPRGRHDWRVAALAFCITAVVVGFALYQTGVVRPGRTTPMPSPLPVIVVPTLTPHPAPAATPRPGGLGPTTVIRPGGTATATVTTRATPTTQPPRPRPTRTTSPSPTPTAVTCLTNPLLDACVHLPRSHVQPPTPTKRGAMKYKVARDAGNGRFVAVAYALLHPLTTVVETITRKGKGE